MRNGMIVDENGDKFWYQNDQLHRTDGPAAELANGTRMWYQNNKRHRTDGPAVEFASGAKSWYQNNQRHRIDGPAVEFIDGTKAWWFKGVQYDLNDWIELVSTTEVQKTLMRLQYA
jgi:hypothetical protein